MPLFSKEAESRHKKASWPIFTLNITKAAEIANVKNWLKENAEGEFIVEALKQTQGTRRMTWCTSVRIKEDSDALMFKLTWFDYFNS